MTATDLSPDRRARVSSRWLIGGLVVVFLTVSVQYGIKVSSHRSAIVRWRQQLEQLEAGEDIYQRHLYPNPPIMALLLRPFAKLPTMVGALSWFSLKALMALVAIVWVFRWIETGSLPFPFWAQALTVLLCLRPIIGDLTHGNVNLFILFLVVAFLGLWRGGWGGVGGVLLGLAIACKVTPALFVPYLAWKRAWRPLLGCLMGLALFFVVVPGLVLGWQRNLDLLESWAEKMIEPYVIQGEVFYSEHPNQSLPGLVFRLVTEHPSFSTYIDHVYTPLEYHHWVSWDPAIARGLVKAAMLLFAGVVVWTCRTPTAGAAEWRLAAECGLVILGMLLFSERTWKHHYVTLLVPVAAVVYALATQPLGRARRRTLVGLLIGAQGLMLSTSSGLLPERFAALMQVYGAYAWANMVLMTALVLVLRGSVGPSCRPSESLPATVARAA
ncbi:MAG: DUF2029 domain-containing protein [Gemmataceae bacterium]|nr:DUF2029 domain-containing protein [Gemmataceae bacterium]MDW8264864.1 glycosyltransferase family 87 protein [Gemmataceae bacterium]